MLLLWYTSGVHKICAWDVFFWKLVLLENWSRFSLSQGGIELSFVRFNCPAISIFNDVVSRKSISLFCFVSGLTLLLEENIQKIDLSQYWQCSWTNFSTQSLPKPTLYYIFLVFLKLLYTGCSSKFWMGYNRAQESYFLQNLLGHPVCIPPWLRCIRKLLHHDFGYYIYVVYCKSHVINYSIYFLMTLLCITTLLCGIIGFLKIALQWCTTENDKFSSKVFTKVTIIAFLW